MKQSHGFFLYEVALSLIVVSLLGGVIMQGVAQIAARQKRLQLRIAAIDRARDYMESMYRHSLVNQQSSSLYTLSSRDLQLPDTGCWSLFLTVQERKKICANSYLSLLTVKWHEEGSDESFNVVYGIATCSAGQWVE